MCTLNAMQRQEEERSCFVGPAQGTSTEWCSKATWHLKEAPFTSNMTIVDYLTHSKISSQHPRLILRTHLRYLMSIKNCLFIGNRAYYEGGAVFTSCVSLDVAQSSFISNTAWLGGTIQSACRIK